MTPPLGRTMIPAMFALYEALLWIVFLALLPWFAIVGFLRGKYWSNFRERLGMGGVAEGPYDVWIQAVSVGEVAAARALVARIRELRPGLSVLITTTTRTGQSMARRYFPTDTVAYFPFDFTFSASRFLRHHRPRIYVTVETEIWPNMVRLARKEGVRVALVNGRISDRSLGRYRHLGFLLRRVLGLYDALLVRSQMDGDRFVAIGAPADRVTVTGNLKFDFEAASTEPPELAAELQRLARGRAIFIAGSTMEGEDEAILPHLPGLVSKGCFVVIAPRKPERFEIVAGLLATSPLKWARRSELEAGNADGADVLLLDTIGELARIYSYAAAAFVGGSLIANGGHNPIEPAAAGIPVCFGPNMSNFREIAETFLAGEGAVEVGNAAELAAFAERMTADPAASRAMGARGRALVEANRGAAEISARRVLELLG